MLFRLAKIALTAASAFFLGIVVLNNITDYGSNFGFVQHVLNMSTTFPGNRLMWRSIDVPLVHHLFYICLISWETLAGMLIGIGAWKLWLARNAPVVQWQKAKGWAAIGFTLSLLQWYVGFLAIGGEWFAMWQSKVWNGQEAAFRLFAIMGISLIFLVMRDDEVTS
jgi:predicted small integral membrane protein